LEQVAQVVMADFPSNMVVPIEELVAVAVLEGILHLEDSLLMVATVVMVQHLLMETQVIVALPIHNTL
jgi:hypothetical protein